MRQRLTAQPDRSTREAKRLLNVWQLYQRVLDLVAPLSHDEAVIERACHLVILAEIVTRWPAMQHRLNQSWDGRRGLQILAAACDDDIKWKQALKVTGSTQPSIPEPLRIFAIFFVSAKGHGGSRPRCACTLNPAFTSPPTNFRNRMRRDLQNQARAVGRPTADTQPLHYQLGRRSG